MPEVLCLSREHFRVSAAGNRQTVVNVDAGVAPKRVPHCQSLRRDERIGFSTTIYEGLRSSNMGGERDYRSTVLNKALQRNVCAIPLQHHKLRRVQSRSLAVPKHTSQRKDLPFSCRQELLHCEFRRGMQIRIVRRSVRADERGPEPVQMGLVSRRSLKTGRLHFDETLGGEPAPQEGRNLRSGEQPATSIIVTSWTPKGPHIGSIQQTPRHQVSLSPQSPKAPGPGD